MGVPPVEESVRRTKTQSSVLVFEREILCILGLAGAKFKQNLTNPRYTCHTCIAKMISYA